MGINEDTYTPTLVAMEADATNGVDHEKWATETIKKGLTVQTTGGTLTEEEQNEVAGAIALLISIEYSRAGAPFEFCEALIMGYDKAEVAVVGGTIVMSLTVGGEQFAVAFAG